MIHAGCPVLASPEKSVARASEDAGDLSARIGWLDGWRGRAVRSTRSLPYLENVTLGRERRILAEELGLWRPSAGFLVPPKAQRQVLAAYLREFGRAVRYGCEVSEILSHFPVPAFLLPPD